MIQNKINEKVEIYRYLPRSALMKLCQGGAPLPGGSDLFGPRDARCAVRRVK